jgi:hypothetical protein
MPQRDTSGIGERVPRELIGADFTVAFSLVEMAEEESRRDNGQIVSQLLQKAEELLDSIRGRLLRMTVAQKEAFETRCAELDEAIQRVKEPDSGSAAEPET